jgi:hypothetical protein
MAYFPAWPPMATTSQSVCRVQEFPETSPVDNAEPKAISTVAKPVPVAPFATI